MSCLFDSPPTLESLLARIEALEAKVMDKPVRQCTEVPPELREAWGMWCLHKASDKRWTAIAKQRQIAKLAEVSGLNSALAVRIVGEAIERGWTTFYPLKQEPKPALNPAVPRGKPTNGSESKLESHMGWLRQQLNLGCITQEDYTRQAIQARERYANH